MKAWCFKLRRPREWISLYWCQSVLASTQLRRTNMTDASNVDKKTGEITSEAVPVEPIDSERDEAERLPKSFHSWLRKVINNFKREGKPVSPPDPKQDRTRALVLLIGGIVGSILLFVGVFSTPPARPSQAPRGSRPNLGRKETPAP